MSLTANFLLDLSLAVTVKSVILLAGVIVCLQDSGVIPGLSVALRGLSVERSVGSGSVFWECWTIG